VLTGSFLCAKAVAERLIELKRPGSIVLVASTSGHRGRPDAFAYCTAKGGALNMARAMAQDLAPYNIRVNSATPTRTGPKHSTWDEIPLDVWVNRKTSPTRSRSWCPTMPRSSPAKICAWTAARSRRGARQRRTLRY